MKYPYKFWNFSVSEKKGYSGVAILSKFKPDKVKFGFDFEKFDREGRIITLQFDKLFIVCCYVPNSGA